MRALAVAVPCWEVLSTVSNFATKHRHDIKQQILFKHGVESCGLELQMRTCNSSRTGIGVGQSCLFPSQCGPGSKTTSMNATADCILSFVLLHSVLCAVAH